MSIRRYSFSSKTSRSPRWTNSLYLEKTVYFFFGLDLQYAWTIIRISSIWTFDLCLFYCRKCKNYELYRLKTRVTRNSESTTTLKTNSLDLLFWICWCTEQEHTLNISRRKSQELYWSSRSIVTSQSVSISNMATPASNWPLRHLDLPPPTYKNPQTPPKKHKSLLLHMIWQDWSEMFLWYYWRCVNTFWSGSKSKMAVLFSY
jgi:hypothetical protein